LWQYRAKYQGAGLNGLELVNLSTDAPRCLFAALSNRNFCHRRNTFQTAACTRCAKRAAVPANHCLQVGCESCREVRRIAAVAADRRAKRDVTARGPPALSRFGTQISW